MPVHTTSFIVKKNITARQKQPNVKRWLNKKPQRHTPSKKVSKSATKSNKTASDGNDDDNDTIAEDGKNSGDHGAI